MIRLLIVTWLVERALLLMKPGDIGRKELALAQIVICRKAQRDLETTGKIA